MTIAVQDEYRKALLSRGKVQGVWLDIAVDRRVIGRIKIRLHDHVTPFTTHNFRSFVAGYRGASYIGSHFFWIDQRGLIGGDFECNDGSGGWSVYGPTFRDEDTSRRHDRPGLVTMANSGRNDTNGSQFIITTQPRPDLDHRHVIFGDVVAGMDIVLHVSRAYGSAEGCPQTTVSVAAAGFF